MAKTSPGKKKKSEKSVYTYKEYIEKLRPKSLGKIEDSKDELVGSAGELTLQRKDCGLHTHHAIVSN